MSDSLSNSNRLLSSLDLGPSWARDAVPRPASRPSSAKSEPEELEHQNPRVSQRGRSFFDDRNDSRGDRRHGRSGHPQSRSRSADETRQQPILPEPGVQVQIEPNPHAVHLIAKEVTHVARVYSLFDISKTILSQRDRFHGVYQVAQSHAPLFHGHRDNSLWLTQEEAIAHFWNATWRADFYEEEQVEIEGPKGNFSVVAKCGLSGKILGPPNYHSYQSSLRQLHREQFQHMPFDRFAARIVVERSEEAVAQWMESMKYSLRWRAIGLEEPGDWMSDRREVERHFLLHRFPEAYVQTHHVEIPANTPGKWFSPSLLEPLKRAAYHANSFPAVLIPSICQLFDREHLPVFKKQGKLFAGPTRPHPLPANTNLADRLAAMLNWLREHPECTLQELWAAVLPHGETEPSPEWLADLYWLLSQGHLLLFADDKLILPTRRQEAEKPDPTQTKIAQNATEKKKKSSKKKRVRNKKRRLPTVLILNQKVQKMTPQQRKLLRGFPRTISHRIRLREQRSAARRAEQSSSPHSEDEL